MEQPRPFIDYYTRHAISPVAQNISELPRHFQTRDALYRHLGIPPRLVRGTSVIEFGPGSGHNSIFTQSLEPRRYVLVDANPTGIGRTKSLLAEYRRGGAEPEIIQSMIQEFRCEERFDLVLCEGVIPTQREPAAFLRHVASFAAPGGVVVMTCVDGVSYLSELLRRLLARALTQDGELLEERVSRLLPVFGPHLDLLPGMTRSHSDWIVDNLLQPFHGPLFPFGEAVETLKDAFSPLGSSPRFLRDWRWHKNIHGPERMRTWEFAIHDYQANVHSLLDCRDSFPPRTPADNRTLLRLCDRVCDEVYRFSETGSRSHLIAVSDLVRELVPVVGAFSPRTSSAMADYNSALKRFIASGTPGDFGAFAPWFGRGQQYLSFIREA